MPDKKKAAGGNKIPPRRVPSDDFSVTDDGQEYFIHAGESVWVVPGTTVEEVRMLRAFDEAMPRILAAEGEANVMSVAIDVLGDAFAKGVSVFRHRIAKWDWTDNDGNPLPQPREEGAFDRLRAEEMTYLALVLQGANTAARKNG